MISDEEIINGFSENTYSVRVRDAALERLKALRDYLGDSYEKAEEIVKSLEIDYQGILPLTIRLGNASVLVKDLNELNYMLELLLYRAGIDLGPSKTKVLMTLTNILRDVLEDESLRDPNKCILDGELLRERNIPAIATELANRFRDINNAKTFYLGDTELGLYCWNGRKYVECESLALKFLEDNYRLNELEKYKIRRTLLAKEFIFALKHSTHYQLKYERTMISYNNLVLDWDALLSWDLQNAFKKHNPDLIIFHHIPHDLNKELILNELKGLEKYTPPTISTERLEKLAEKYTPKTLKAFKVWVGKKWILLYEIIGAVQYPKPIKKAFLIYGPTDGGKSTLLKLIMKLIGKDNYSSVKLQALINPEYRFMTYRIYGKLANIYADLPISALRNLGEFKVLTGGDSIEVERKFRDPFTWNNVYVKFIFSCNKPPKIANLEEADEAFWRRWLVVEFPNPIPEDKKIDDFENILLSEAPNILAISILAFYNVIRRGYRFSYENTAEDAKNKWLSATDSVYAWLLARKNEGVLVEDKTARTESSKLYEDYINWCETNEVDEDDRVDQGQFTKRLKRYGLKAVTKERKTYFMVRLGQSPHKTLG